MHLHILSLALIWTILLTDVTHGTERRWRRKDTKKREDKQEIWNQDASDLFKIDPSTQGIKKVNLKCGSNSMLVYLETDDDFTGVMYTKGNFYDQAEPCFMKPKSRAGSRSLVMRFPFDKCNTKQVGDVFKNVVVVQHDPELVTPGDAAFEVECDFRKPRNLNVEATYEASKTTAYASRITLTSPDPSFPSSATSDHEHTITNTSNIVTFQVQKDTKTPSVTQKVIGSAINIPLHDTQTPTPSHTNEPNTKPKTRTNDEL